MAWHIIKWLERVHKDAHLEEVTFRGYSFQTLPNHVATGHARLGKDSSMT